MASRNHGPRIVVGLDYGTTYTGLAWKEVRDSSIPPLSELEVFKLWPEKESPKVPSDLSYSETINGKKQWGHDIDDNSLVLQWTKMNIEVRSPERELKVLGDLVKGLDRMKNFQQTRGEVPQHLARNASDVVRDYLIRVVREWYLWMRSQPGPRQHILTSIPLDLVITHPALWSYDAMNTTYRAVMAAFPKSMFKTLERVMFISEPEACALYTMEDLARQQLLERLVEGDCFVVCDAGGGTVDVVSYRLESIKPLKIKKVGTVTGDKYGATCVDRAFLEWLQPKVQNLNISPTDVGDGGHFAVTKAGRLLLSRFERLKHSFDGEIGGEIQLHRGATVNPGQEEHVVNRRVKLTKEALREIFSESVQGTVELIRKQVAQVQNPRSGETPGLVSHIFLAGGFAENPHVFNEVESYANKNGIIAKRADDCWSGVAKGAVLTGMGLGAEPLAEVGYCPRHYGFCADRKYSAALVAPDQISWLVRQKDAILPGSPIVATFDVRFSYGTSMSSSSSQKLQLRFVATELAVAPPDISQVPADENEVATMEIRWQQVECCVRTVKGQNRFSRHNELHVVAELRVDAKGVTATISCCKVLATYSTSL